MHMYAYIHVSFESRVERVYVCMCITKCVCISVCVFVYQYVCLCVYHYVLNSVSLSNGLICIRCNTISRLLKIIGHFYKRAL